MSTTEVPRTGIFLNPILHGFNPDPSIVRVGEDYYCTTSTFEFFPGAPIYHSKDLIKWTLIGHALTRKSQLDIKTPEPGGGVWATTLRYHNGYFYITTGVFDRYRPQMDDRVWPRGFYVRTSDIWNSSSWTDPVYFDQPGFDQDLFWDDDGTAYLSTTYRKLDRAPGSRLKDFAIHVCTIDIETGDSTSTPTMLRESQSGISEGSHIFKRGKYHYLFTAEGGTESGHCEWVMRSENGPMGPYELGPNNPLWRNTTDDEIQNTGHCDLVEDVNGKWWAVSLGVRPNLVNGEYKTSVFGRESLLLPVEWEDDWPIFNNAQRVTLRMDGPLYEHEPSRAWRDDFKGNDMQLGWYRKNTPLKVDWSLKGDPQNLELYGGPYTLSVPAAPTMFVRKQTHREVIWSTQLNFQPTSSRTEAGTTLYWNYDTYSSIGIRLMEGKRSIRFRPAEGSEQHIPLKTAEHDVFLAIHCQPTNYRFGFLELEAGSTTRDIASSVNWVGEISVTAMTKDPAVGMAFTGMTLGLYAFGEMERCLVPAVFKFAEFS